MQVLALDTATPATAVALCIDDAVLEARDDPDPGQRPRHAAALLPLAAGLLDRASRGAGDLEPSPLAFKDLDRIAVGVGPGTFTGLRIGVASARGLARAAGVPLVGVPTLQSLAMNACSPRELEPGSFPEPELVVPVMDARRQEVFAAAWRRSELSDPAGLSENALIAPAAFAPEALAERLRPLATDWLAVGEGAVEFREVLERSGAFVPPDESVLHVVTAVNHCLIARHLDPADPDAVNPQYLRLPDAEIARRAAGKE